MKEYRAYVKEGVTCWPEVSAWDFGDVVTIIGVAKMGRHYVWGYLPKMVYDEVKIGDVYAGVDGDRYITEKADGRYVYVNI